MRTLSIRDSKTGQEWTVEVDEEHGTIDACHLKDIRIYDPAFMNTAVCRSEICSVDGERGELLYRGFRIEDLVQGCSFLEVAFTLIYGHLPSEYEYEAWQKQIMTHTFTHVRLNELMRSFNYDAHPMGMFISSMAAMSTFHPEANPALKVRPAMFTREGYDIYLKNERLCNKQIHRIIGKATTVAANAYRHRIGRDFNYPQNGLGYAENFLYMLDALAEREYRPHPVLVEAIDKLFIIHAEHEMNCSTAAMCHIASSLVDPYSAIAGAAAALFGPLHGGANEAVLQMLEGIKTVDNIPEFIEAVKRKEKRLMGFGHRVYKSYDPRAKIVRDILHKVFSVCGTEPLLQVALALEQVALSDHYFTSRKLYPNVDFYTGLIYKAMGFPSDFFPLLFAIPRIVGWLAHWREMLQEASRSGNDAMRIWRPRQVYCGERVREFVAMSARRSGSPPESLSSDRQVMYKRYFVSQNRERKSN